MQKFNKTRKKWIKKHILAVCVVGILLSTPMVSIAVDDNSNGVTSRHYSLYQPRTYHNATLFIISHVYYVKHADDEAIHLSARLPSLPGIFHVQDKNGTQEFNLFGGWAGSRVEIYGFDGLFKGQGLYTVLIGNCSEISIIPIREIS
jgi:hypothetical protein